MFSLFVLAIAGLTPTVLDLQASSVVVDDPQDKVGLMANQHQEPAIDGLNQTSTTPPVLASQPPADKTTSKVKTGKVVRCIFKDSRGNLWVGGEDDLVRSDGKVFTTFDIKDDLGNGVTIKEIVEDHDGNIWCGTTGGLTKIVGASFTSYGEKDGLVSRDVWSLAVGDDGTLWIGTIKGVCRFDGTTFTVFTIPKSKPDYTRGVTSATIVHCITVDQKSHVWFGTNGGAYVFDGNRLALVSTKDGLPSEVVHNIIQDKAGHVWFGTTHGGISRFDGNQFTNYTKNGRVEGTEIWSIYEDGSGNVWFSGKRFGTYRYDGSTFQRFRESNGLTSPGIMSICEDQRGQLWLGGIHGLFRYKDGAFEWVKTSGPW